MEKFISLEELEYFNPIDGLKAKLVHTETQTYAFWKIDAGTHLPEHQHPHEQISFVTRGKLELTIDNETRIISKGTFAYIPPNTNHSAKAISDVELTDVFSPVREDFITKNK